MLWNPGFLIYFFFFVWISRGNVFLNWIQALPWRLLNPFSPSLNCLFFILFKSVFLRISCKYFQNMIIVLQSFPFLIKKRVSIFRWTNTLLVCPAVKNQRWLYHSRDGVQLSHTYVNICLNLHDIQYIVLYILYLYFIQRCIVITFESNLLRFWKWKR